jgi:5-hydroxydodecatetraenal polyketide synthase CpkA
VVERDDSSMTSTREVTHVAVVTGASRGVGRLFALSLARSGTRVIAISRPSEDHRSLEADADGSPLRTHAADVTDPAQVDLAFQQAASDAGPPHLVVTCAGSAEAIGPIASVDPDRWWHAVSVDLRGTMLCAQAALKWMLPAGFGRIVTVYGNLGDHGAAHVSAFATAKAGIAQFTETLATELTGTGIVALAMHPGFVRTPMTEHLAWSAEGRRWLPEFGQRAEHHWGDGTPAIELLDRITNGEADSLSGRIIHVGDDLAELTLQARSDDRARRLRIDSVT